MCGVIGIAALRAAPVDIQECIPYIRHRGPDGSGVLTGYLGRDLPKGWYSLAHTRLAINDLSSAGLQPMRDRGGDLILSFNGEIYNYPELRAHCEQRGRRFRSRMDGEVILHLWDLYGPECLSRLNGIYAFSLVDELNGTVHLVRDPLGVKPLFMHRANDGTLTYASEISALRQLVRDDGGLDPTSLGQFLTFLWIPDPNTPYRALSSVPPGHHLRWRAGEVDIAPFVDRFVPTGVANAPRQGADLVEEGWTLFQRAVKRQMMSDAPVGLMASGGTDSSLVWAAVPEALAGAFTISWESGDSEGVAEDTSAVARCEAHFRTPVSYIEGESWDRRRLPRAGDLVADPAYELTRQIAVAARRKGVKVLLSGHGGDELFAGYRRHTVARLLGQGRDLEARWLLSLIQRRLPDALNAEYGYRMLGAFAYRDPIHRYLHLCSYSNQEERARALGCETSEVGDEQMWQRHVEIYESLPSHLSFLRKVMAVDLMTYLPSLGLVYTDRAGMEEGVEIRVPFLDHEFVRWSLALPDSALQRWGRSRWIQKEMARRVLPRPVTERPKRGFGVPRRLLRSSASGSRGYRQGSYFGYALDLLDAYTENSAAIP